VFDYITFPIITHTTGMTHFLEREQKLWVGAGENNITRNFIICTLQKNLADRKIKEYEMDGAKSI